MYVGNAARIYNPQPDPLERGPPKRVQREETHIGEMVAASKKRISWRFTLGECERVHEVVLVHSVMSYKKVVQYDGRQMHFSSSAVIGDWSFTMILDGLNCVMEVRINDLDSGDVPKYDFVIDRVPFRRWDVYRRKKHVVTTATYAQPNAPSGNAYGTHRWGPGGATAPQNESQPTRGSFTGNSPPEARARSFSGNRDGRMRSFSGQHDGAAARPPAAPVASKPKPKKQPEINLIDDFEPSVSVSAQQLLFDPFAGAKMSSPRGPTNMNAPVQQQPPQSTALPTQHTPYVDPFAAVDTPAPMRPSTNATFDPFAAQSGASMQQLTRPMSQASVGVSGVYQQPTMRVNMDMGGSGVPQQQQQQQQQQQTRGSFMEQQQPVGAASQGINYNISQLMNPANLSQTSRATQPGKNINIDAFAGMGR